MSQKENDVDAGEIRLLLEEICCDIGRFEQMLTDGSSPAQIIVEREVDLGVPDAFADIRIRPPGQAPYFIEVKTGYSDDRLIRQLKRKYSQKTEAMNGARKVVVLTNVADRPNWVSLKQQVINAFAPDIELEIWDESRFTALINKHFHLQISSLNRDNLLDVREAVSRTKGFHAFGGSSAKTYRNDPLRSQLLWHFAYWRLLQLRKAGRVEPGDVLPPKTYRSVAVVLADICSFSAYVRDTGDERITRQNLTAFYSRARYQIINNGGMLYEFAGDSVIGLFGIPDRATNYPQTALETAKRLLTIGESVSNEWQRQIDRVQPTAGLHVGIAIGDLQIVYLQPFSRTHVGAIGDTINLAARLMTAAGPGELMISNAFYNELQIDVQAQMESVAPVEAKNLGRIKAWRFSSKKTPT